MWQGQGDRCTRVARRIGTCSTCWHSEAGGRVNLDDEVGMRAGYEHDVIFGSLLERTAKKRVQVENSLNGHLEFRSGAFIPSR